MLSLRLMKHSSNGLLGWHYSEAVIKLWNLKFYFCFITLGHFLLLSSSPAAEDSGICDYHLTSPVLPGSYRNCLFQVALYEAGPAVGNLTLLIKPVLSGSAIHSVVLNHKSREHSRSANTLTVQRAPHVTVMPFVWNSYLFIYLFGMQHMSIKSHTANPASLIEVPVKLRSSL